MLPSLLRLYVCKVLCERAGLGFGLFLCVLGRRDFHVGQVAEGLVSRDGQLARLVDSLLALFGLLGGGLTRRRPLWRTRIR